MTRAMSFAEASAAGILATDPTIDTGIAALATMARRAWSQYADTLDPLYAEVAMGLEIMLAELADMLSPRAVH